MKKNPKLKSIKQAIESLKAPVPPKFKKPKQKPEQPLEYVEKILYDDLPRMTMLIHYKVALHKIKYDSLVKAGFNVQQALELCKNVEFK